MDSLRREYALHRDSKYCSHFTKRIQGEIKHANNFLRAHKELKIDDKKLLLPIYKTHEMAWTDFVCSLGDNKD